MTHMEQQELRVKALEMAKEYLDQKMNVRLELARQRVEYGGTGLSKSEYLYEFFSTDDLKNTAQEFYDFLK